MTLQLQALSMAIDLVVLAVGGVSGRQMRGRQDEACRVSRARSEVTLAGIKVCGLLRGEELSRVAHPRMGVFSRSSNHGC